MKCNVMFLFESSRCFVIRFLASSRFSSSASKQMKTSLSYILSRTCIACHHNQSVASTMIFLSYSLIFKPFTSSPNRTGICHFPLKSKIVKNMLKTVFSLSIFLFMRLNYVFLFSCQAKRKRQHINRIDIYVILFFRIYGQFLTFF